LPQELDVLPATGPVDEVSAASGEFSRGALRRLMTAKAGVLRNGEFLREAWATLAGWFEDVCPELAPQTADPRVHEDANLLLAAQLLVHAARERTDSLGAHYRDDSLPGAANPEALDEEFRISPKASLVHD
jgi:L-aspartate oxidase